MSTGCAPTAPAAPRSHAVMPTTAAHRRQPLFAFIGCEKNAATTDAVLSKSRRDTLDGFSIMRLGLYLLTRPFLWKAFTGRTTSSNWINSQSTIVLVPGNPARTSVLKSSDRETSA